VYSFDHKIRVRYGETDTMGVVYHGNYPLYYEEARTEMLRAAGLPYIELEQQGVMMPVRDMSITYLQPAYYDDLLTVRVMLAQPPTVRVAFTYQIFNQHGLLINEAAVTLVFVNAQTRKPCRAPQLMLDLMEQRFGGANAGT
jgi:acyl-CoA thioester hydrolase